MRQPQDYINARSVWDSYATLADDPPEDWDPVRRTSIRLMRWERHNFGIQSHLTGVLGMYEEIGELGEAKKVDDKIDAVGDILIFASNLCMKSRIDFACLLEYLKVNDGDLLILMGRLSHVVLKHEQKIRGFGDPDFFRPALFGCLQWILGHNALDYGRRSCYLTTAEHVLKREWR